MDPISGQCQEEIWEIVLTFDDGPNPKTTPKLLDFLGEHDIKVIFFVIGKKLLTEPGLSIVRRAYKEGHIIGNHSFSHPNLVRIAKPKIREEVLRAHDIICKYTGICNLFRPPYGLSNRTIKQILDELGYTQMFWTVDTMDWKYNNDHYWVDHGIKQLKFHKNNIILMHDIYHNTVDNFPYIVKLIKSIPNIHFSVLSSSDKLCSRNNRRLG